MSSIISNDFFSPCVVCRYTSTHSTRWSLNTPLINWWRRSGARSSWISARGKKHVNGCPIPCQTNSHGKQCYYILQYRVELQSRPTECVGWMSWEGHQFSHVSVDDFRCRQDCLVAHRTLHKKQSVTRLESDVHKLTLGTSWIWCQRARPVLDSQQCTAQDWKSCGESAHPGISWFLA